MEHNSANWENEIKSITRDAKNIMILSLISLPVTPLFLITLIYFFIYINKLKKLKINQPIGKEYSRLKAKKTKELRSIKWNTGSSDEKSLAGLLLAHRTTLIVFIVITIVIACMIGYIGLAYKMGWV